MAKINLIEDDPIVLSALAAKISQTPFEKGDIFSLYEEIKSNKDKAKNLVNQIMKKGHLIFGDFLSYAIVLEDISRFAAIYLWRNVNVHNLVFGAGIEASFRVVKPNRFKEELEFLGQEIFEIYEKALQAEIPEQDARYLLPEGVLTRMIFFAPPRYLSKLASDFKNKPLSELQEIGEKIESLIKERFGFEIPEEKLPSQWQFWGEKKNKETDYFNYEGNIHSLSLKMEIKGSLAMYAQLVRQRQLLVDLEPLERIARRGKFVVPLSFNREIREAYREIAKRSKQKQLELLEKKDPNFVYFLLLGQEAKSVIYGSGVGVIETSRSRSEGVAQWEIRNVVGIPITEELARYRELRNEIGPRCWREKRCIEPATFRRLCPAFKKTSGVWQDDLESLLQILKEKYKTFII